MTKRFQKEMSNRAKEVKIEFVGFSNISQFIAKKTPTKFTSVLPILSLAGMPQWIERRLVNKTGSFPGQGT